MNNVQRFQVNPDVSCADQGEDGALLYNPEKDKSTLLNATGRKVWTYLAVPHSLEEVAAHLADAFSGVTSEQARQDVTKFVKSLNPDFIMPASGPTGVGLSADSREELKGPGNTGPLEPSTP